MLSLSPETVKEIQSIINNRISKAPTTIKDKFKFQYRNQKTIIEKYGNTLLVILLSPKEIKSLNWRQKKGIAKFPALLTPKIEAPLFVLKDSHNVMISGIYIEDSHVFYVGPNSSLIIEDISIGITKSHVGPINYNIDLGFIINTSTETNLYSLTEILDDLVVYYIKNKREVPHDLSV